MSWRASLPWVLIALTPAIFAVATWNTSNDIVLAQAWMRLFGVPAAVIEVFVICYAILVGAQPLDPIGSVRPWAKLLLATLIAIAMSTALFVAPQTFQSVSWTFQSIIHLLFGLSVAGLARQSISPERGFIWCAIVVGLCGYALILVVFINSVPDPGRFDWEHFRLAVTNVRQVGFYSAIGAAAALGLAATRKGVSALMLAAAASTLLGLSFWTGTRGSLIAIVIAFVVGSFLLPQLRNVRSWAFLVGAMLTGAILSLLQPAPYFLFGLSRMFASAAAHSADAVSSGRLVIWRGTLDAIMQRPLFGYGEGQFPFVVPVAQAFNHPHNIILQLLVQWGLAGTLIFAALASLVAVQLKRALATPSPDQVPPFLVLVSLLTMSLYEGTFFHTYPLMMIAFSVAMLGQEPRGRGDSTRDGRGSTARARGA